jgi:putative sterol carrier protein
MSKFLSPQWAEALVASLNDSGTGASLPGVSFKLQQVVTGSDGDVSYWIALHAGRFTGGIGPLADADVTITQDYPTAVELARGEVNAQAAFMQGKLKVTGNMAMLLQNQEAIAALGPAMSAIQTDY